MQGPTNLGFPGLTVGPLMVHRSSSPRAPATQPSVWSHRVEAWLQAGPQPPPQGPSASAVLSVWPLHTAPPAGRTCTWGQEAPRLSRSLAPKLTPGD